MGKKRKPKYEDLSDKERGRLEQEGMKANSNDVSVSALDAGRSAYKEELKTRKKTNKSQKKDLKKRGETTVIQPETPREKKVKSATKQVEKMTNSPETWEGMTQDEVDAQKIRDNSTWVNTDGTITEARTTSTPGRNKDASSSAAPTYTTDPRFTTEKGKENISAQALKAVVDGNPIPQEEIDAAMAEVDQVDVAITEEQKKVQALTDAVDLSRTDDESEQDKMTTVDDLVLTASDIQDQIEAGNPDAEAMMKEFQDYAKDAKMNTGEPAIEKLGLQQYYPDLGTPLQVGSYSGSRIGTVSIFGAGSNRLPMGVIDARRRALEKAANTQAKKKNEIIEMAYAKGAIPLQKRIDNKSWEIINKYSELSGNDITSLDYNTKLGRQFWKEIREHQTFAERTKMTEATVKKLTKDILDENVYVPDSVQKEMRRFNEGMIKDNMDLKSIYKIEKNLRSWTEATHVLDKFNKTKLDLDKAPVNPNTDWSDPKVVERADAAMEIISGGNYDNIYTLTKEFLDPYRINRLINPVIKQEGLYLGDGSVADERKHREEYFNYVLGLHPEKIEAQLKTVIHNSRNKAKSRASSERIANPPTILDELNNKMNSTDKLAARQKLLMETDLLSQGGSTNEDVSKAYFEFTDLERKGTDPNDLTGVIPLTDKELNTEYEAPVTSMNYSIDGRDLDLESAVKLIEYKRDQYALTTTGTADMYLAQNPEYMGLLKLSQHPDKTAKYRMTSAEHNFAFNNEDGVQEKATVDTYAANESNVYGLVTRKYSGTFTAESPRLDENGDQAMGYTVDGYQVTKEEAEEVGAGAATLVPLTQTIEYALPIGNKKINIKDDVQRAIGNARYKDETRQLGVSFKSGNTSDSDDGVIESSSSSSSSSSDDGAAFNDAIEQGR